MGLFGNGDEIIRTLGFYQPFCSLMLHGKIETRWVRMGKKAPFPLGRYLLYTTKSPCTDLQLTDWCGDELTNHISAVLSEDQTLSLNGYALCVGELYYVGDMDSMIEKECFVKYKGVIKRKDKYGREHDYNQRTLYFKNIQSIIPFEFKFGKQGVGILDKYVNPITFLKPPTK